MSQHRAARRGGLYAALTGHLVISAFTYLIAKYALGVFPVARLALLRFLLASSAHAVVWLVRGGRPGEIAGRDWGRLTWLGFLALPLNQGCFLLGLSWSSPAHAALFYSTTPLFVLGISALRGEERLSWVKIAGVVTALVGVTLILLDKGLRLDRRYLAGDLLLLVAVASWGLYSVECKSMMRRHSAITVTALSMVLGTVMALPLAPAAFAGFHIGEYGPAAWGSVAFLALMTSVAAYYMYGWALARAEATRVAVFSNFQPVATTLLTWLFFHEQFAPWFFLGGGLVMAGVLVVQLL